MARKLTENMNVLPRLSNRWLKVNHLNFAEEVYFPLKAYNLPYLPENEVKKIALSDLGRQKFKSLKQDSENHGISKELTTLAEEHFNAGFAFEVPANAKLKTPILIDYSFDQQNDALIDYNLILAQENSSITVIVNYANTGNNQLYHNGLTKILAQEGAEVTLIKIQRLGDQDFHFDAQLVDLAPRATVRYIQVELGSKYSITNYQARLGESSLAEVDGMYLGDGRRELDLSYHMIHEGYRSTSDILVKGALKDTSRKVFRGTLDFKRGAHLADGNEEEYVILLDPTVKSDAIPLLLSEEDDVQGGHAASCGKVDSDQLFYLMTRGLSEDEATEAIVKGSYQHVLDQLPVRLKTEVQKEIHRRLVANYV